MHANRVSKMYIIECGVYALSYNVLYFCFARKCLNLNIIYKYKFVCLSNKFYSNNPEKSSIKQKSLYIQLKIK